MGRERDLGADAVIDAALSALVAAMALHGLGRLVGWIAGDDDAPFALAVAWGLALFVAVGGWLAALGMFHHDGQLVVVVTGVLIGPVWAVRRGLTRSSPSAPRSIDDLVVVLLTVGLVAIRVAGAIADSTAFRDVDGDLLGPLERLTQLGSWADPNAPRASGLGGAVVVTSLGWLFGDWRASGVVDAGLGVALAVALAFGLRSRDRLRNYTGFAVAALALALPSLSPDLQPRWSIAALVLALVATWRRAELAPRRHLAAAIVAGAAAAISYGGFGLVAVALLAAPARVRWKGCAVALAVIAGYLWIGVSDGLAVALALPRVVVGGAVALLSSALLSVATRDLGDGPTATALKAIAVALAVSMALAPSWLAASQLMLPFALAAVVLAVLAGLAALSARDGVSPLALIAAFAVVFLLAGLRVPLGVPPRTHAQTFGAAIDGIRAGANLHRDGAIERAGYRAAFEAIPTGARVGLWVDRADLVEYRQHEVVDLRRGRFAEPTALSYLVLSPSATLPEHHPVRALVYRGVPMAVPGHLVVVDLRLP